MPKEDIDKYCFSRSHVKGQSTSQAHWLPWHLNNHNSVNLGIIKMKQKLNVLDSITMVLRQPKIGFTFSFQDHLMPHLVAILDGCKVGSLNLAAE